MARTLFGDVTTGLRNLTNRSPIVLAPSGGRSGLVSSIVRPAGQEAQMRAMGSVGTLFAIVERITTAYSQVEWKLYRSAPSGRDEDRKEVTSHAALDLWLQPNGFMTGPQWREATQQHEELTGEQWWIISRHERSSLPLELWFTRPDRMTPIPDRDNFLSGYVYSSPTGEQVPLGTDDVIMLRRPNPLDPYRGWGPVQTLLADLDASKASAEWNANFFHNSAQPGGIVQVDKRLSDEEFNEFNSRWREQHRGVGNAHRVAVLENGLTWVDRSYSMADMQFAELRSVSREIIREAFAFPKPMLGTVDDANRANMEAANDMLARWLIRPRLERIRQALNTRLLPMFGATGKGLEFDFEDPVTGDVELESKQLVAQANAVKLLTDSGAYGPAALAAVGLPDIPFGAPDADPDRELLIKLVTRAPLLAPIILPMLGYDLPEGAQAASAASLAPAPAASWDQSVAGLFGPALAIRNADSDPLEQMRQDHETALDGLLDDFEPIEDDWIDELGDQIEQAIDDEDTAALAGLSLDSADAADTVRVALGSAAQQAANRMADEAKSQGVKVTAPKVDESLTARLRPGMIVNFGDELNAIATAVASLIASGLAASAAQEAVRRFVPGVSGKSVATAVKGKLRQLKGVFKRDQLGGAIHRAQNVGRIATLEAAPEAHWVASEKNDGNTCLAPETRVTTRNGLLYAKDVTLDDELLTHTGRFTKPSRIVVSEVEEQLTRVVLSTGTSLRLTWDHPVLVHDGDGFVWRNAGDLSVGDLVVSESTLELSREPGSLDLRFGESPDDVPTVGDVSGLPLVDVRAQRMPVRPVGFDHECVAHQEVDDPGADLDLRAVGVPQVFEGLADSALNAGLGVAGAVAADGAVPLARAGGGDDAKLAAAVLAGDGDGRAAAGLGAVPAVLNPGMAEGCATPRTDGVDSASLGAALPGAVGVPAGDRNRDAELAVAVRADLGDLALGRTDLGPQIWVGELALHRAVEGAGSLPALDLSRAHLAQPRRPARISTQPSGTRRTNPAERPLFDADTAGRTRLVHNLSIEVDGVNALVIAAIEREQYRGEVYDFTIPEDETFWAEGVLVHNCSPCKAIDGTSFATLHEVTAAYGAGPYHACQGGVRCRGTVTAQWNTTGGGD